MAGAEFFGRLTRWILRWLTTTNHKDIGILYMVTSVYFFFIAGVLALLFRTQLAMPASEFLTGKAYYEAVTVHGLIMLLWFASPFAAGLANYFVPLQIGARDLAFPRLNALSYWLYLASGILVILGFLAEAGAIDVGWTMYAPLTSKEFTPSPGVDLAVLGVALLSLSVTISTINFLVTIATMRAPGLSWFKLPMFTWSIIFTMILMLYAFPPLMVGAAILWIDRNIGTEFFSSPAGGALLWDHLFWFFGHPEVYILLFPALGAIADIVSTFARRPLYAKRYILTAFFLATILSFLVWMHHMFVTGTNLYTRLFYSFTTILISIPFEMATVSLILTLYKGKIRFTIPMLFALAAIFHFILGGSTGVYLGSIALDKGFRGTYWVVAHFHYILVGTMLFGFFAALYYWFPKITGKMYSKKLALLHFILATIGLNLTFFPQFIIFDMPRRYFTYDVPEWLTFNQLSTLGSYIFGLSMIVALITIVHGLLRGSPAPENPWRAWTLEWLTKSPPPPENFEGVPVVTNDGRVVFVSEEVAEKSSRAELVSGKLAGVQPLTGASHAAPSHSHAHSHPVSIDPFILGVGSLLALFGLVVNKFILAAGIAVLAWGLYRWLRDELNDRFHAEIPKYLETWPFPRSKLRNGMWVFIASEVMVFGSILSAYFFIRFNPVGKVLEEPWPPGYMIHDVGIGIINTMIMFTSTLSFAMAYLGVRKGDNILAQLGMIGTIFLGSLFLIVKYFEWKELFAAGYGLDWGLATQTYYLATGVHGLHVALGLLLTTYLLFKLYAGRLGPQRSEEVLMVAIYWGIVEIVWTFIFPLFYLV